MSLFIFLPLFLRQTHQGYYALTAAIRAERCSPLPSTAFPQEPEASPTVWSLKEGARDLGFTSACSSASMQGPPSCGAAQRNQEQSLHTAVSTHLPSRWVSLLQFGQLKQVKSDVLYPVQATVLGARWDQLPGTDQAGTEYVLPWLRSPAGG